MDSDTSGVVRRPDRGLTIAGTRVTLYRVLAYLHAGWSQDAIRDWLDLTEAQVQAAVAYLAAHQDDVETEQAQMQREAAEVRRYWEERNQQREARLEAAQPTAVAPEKAALYAKLAAQRGRTLRALLDGPERGDAQTTARTHQA